MNKNCLIMALLVLFLFSCRKTTDPNVPAKPSPPTVDRLTFDEKLLLGKTWLSTERHLPGFDEIQFNSDYSFKRSLNQMFIVEHGSLNNVKDSLIFNFMITGSWKKYPQSDSLLLYNMKGIATRDGKEVHNLLELFVNTPRNYAGALSALYKVFTPSNWPPIASPIKILEDGALAVTTPIPETWYSVRVKNDSLLQKPGVFDKVYLAR